MNYKINIKQKSRHFSIHIVFRDDNDSYVSSIKYSDHESKTLADALVKAHAQAKLSQSSNLG